MSEYKRNPKIELSKIRISLASPETIRSWSHGEVLEAETINYRHPKPVPNGLFCERIFGPVKDYRCYCGKYTGKIKNKGQVCEKCGVEITTKDVRRERMGHIELAVPCAHTWFLKGSPSKMALTLDMPIKQLEDITYFCGFLCLDPGTSLHLYQKQYINESNGREIFAAILEEIAKRSEDDAEFGTDTDRFDYDENGKILFKYSKGFTYRYNDKGEVIAQSVNVKKGETFYDFVYIYIEQVRNSPTFSYLEIFPIINRFTGAKFGQGAEAIETLLKEVGDHLDEIALDLRKELKSIGKANATSVKLVKRLEVIENFRQSGNRPEWMILRAIPVIPPDLRPLLTTASGRPMASDLNELYKTVITRNKDLKKFIEQSGTTVMIHNAARLLQDAVDSLINNDKKSGKPATSGSSNRPLKSFSEILKGKQGRFRQHLLGKRVDYSGRSVIAIGPDLRIYQCGLPKEMALKLFEPFIIHELIQKDPNLTLTNAERKIASQSKEVFDIVEAIIGQHPVLLNRAPTLHRLGIQAFQAKLVNGRAIRLHPLVCAGFNADFDGDTMSVHVPLTKEAQQEAVSLMLASNNILSPKDGKPIVTPSQDIVIGNYYLTTECNKEYFLNKAKELREQGDIQEAQHYEDYADAEGKVFRNFNEVYTAYQTKKVSLKNRIAIPGKALEKTGFTEEMNNSYLITSVGKLIFNKVFPADFPYINGLKSKDTKIDVTKDSMDNFVPRGTNIKEYIENQPTRFPIKKKDLGNIIDEVFHRYGTSKTSAIIDLLKDQGFKFATKSGVTVSISDIVLIPDKHDIIAEGDRRVALIDKKFNKGAISKKEHYDMVVDVWNKQMDDKVKNSVKNFLEKDIYNPFYIMFDSGARGGLSSFKQLIGFRGPMKNTAGKIIELPIKSSFLEGANIGEFFIGTHGARKGGADTALKTSKSGYLTRRLVYAAQSVVVTEEDCHTDHGSIVKDIINNVAGELKVLVKLEERLIGRFSLKEITHPTTGEVIVPENTLITEEMAKAVVNAGIKEVEIRTIFGCETKNGVCQHCYGRGMSTGNVIEIGQAVGITAAQSIGEPGTQLTMRTFHTGGIANDDDITSGLPRVEQLFDGQKIEKGAAVISKFEGDVTEFTELENGRIRVVVKNNIDTETYESSTNAKPRVKLGDHVLPGQKIFDGSISLQELLDVADVNTVAKYIMKEVHKVYKGNDITINDKHIEIIIKQMLKRVYIIQNGDTDLLPGTRVSIEAFTKANTEALLAGKRPAVAKPILLGIKKSALETDSFLSAASFQETTRILTDSAIKGKVDTLRGLKENVITGKLIPAGTGLRSEEAEKAIVGDFDVATSIAEIEKNYDVDNF